MKDKFLVKNTELGSPVRSQKVINRYLTMLDVIEVEGIAVETAADDELKATSNTETTTL